MKYICIYMHNGVEQGGVVSAILFCIFIDEFRFRLERAVIGCDIDDNYYGKISYIDDLKLVCPSINELQNMLDIMWYFVTCNISKKIAISYGKPGGKPKRSLHLKGSSIRREPSVKYLGKCIVLTTLMM